MNTKGIKFLAVLAVMAMAFAAVIVLAPADNDVIAENVYAYDDAQKDPAEITWALTAEYDSFYFSDDATVKVTGLSENIVIYVQNGKEIELNIKPVAESEGESAPTEFTNTITIYSVTGDLKRHTTSTVDGAAVPDDESTGKIVIKASVFAFYGVKGETVLYTSLMPVIVDTHTTSSDGKKVVVSDIETSYYGTTGTQQYAIVSADKALNSPTIGGLVAVAPSQYLEVTGDVDGVSVFHGIHILDASDSTNYYYAAGADAGTFEIASGDYVEIVNGSITILKDEDSIKATSVKGVKIDDDFTVYNLTTSGMTAGSMTISGTVAFDGTFKIGSSASVIISNNTVVSGNIEVNGKLYVKTDKDKFNKDDTTLTGSGTVYAQNPKLWQLTTDTPAVPYVYNKSLGNFKGLMDVSAITEVATVTDRFATAEIAPNQTFRVVGDVVVTTSLTVKGILIIDEGASITISKFQKNGAAITVEGQYAQLINNGQLTINTTYDTEAEQAAVTEIGLHIKGGYAVNNSKIIASSDTKTVGHDTFSVNFGSNGGLKFINKGEIRTSSTDSVLFDDHFENNGKVSIGGGIATTSASTSLVNKGEFELNNAKVSGSMSITTKAGAQVKISAQIEAGTGTITVNHGSTNIAFGGAVITSTNDPAYVTVRGVTITDVTISDSFPTLDVYGPMSVNKVGTTEVYATLTMAGLFDITAATTIGERMSMNISAATISVYDNLTITKLHDGVSDARNGTSPTLKVYGKVVDNENRLSIDSDKFIGARYILPTDGTTIFTTLEDAIPEAVAADTNNVDVGYIKGAKSNTYPVLYEDITIPEGMFVNGYGLTIGSALIAPTVVVEDSASFSFRDVVLVEGCIVAENVNDVDSDAIHADVKTVDRTTYSGKFMSLRVALAAAQPGDVIELSQDFENISRDLTIPAGVTVSAIDDIDGDHYFVMIDSNLVVDGTLIVDDFWFIATTDDTKSITVNGMIMDRHTSGSCFAPWWYVPDGVSYRLTIPDEYGNEETWYVITNIANLQQAIYDADESKVWIEGNPKIGDVTIRGTEDEPADVTFNGNINAGTLTLENAIIKAKDGKKVTATFADALGSITITGAYVDKKLSIYSLGDEGVYMAGAVVDTYDGTYSIRFDGLTGIDGTTKSTIGWGKYDKADPSILFNGVTTATGKKVEITQNYYTPAVEVADGMTTITGTLIADNGTKLVINSDVQVLGALVAAERTEDAVAGSIDILGNVFVGALESDIYSPEDAVYAYAEDLELADPTVGYGHCMEYEIPVPVPDTGDVASISGKIYVASGSYITVMAGSMIDPAIVEDLLSMNVIIEDELWLTVYADEKTEYSMDGLKAPIVNAKVSDILNEDGVSVAKFSQKYKVVYGCPDLTLDNYGDVYFILNYEAFTVTIKTDGSVKAVYIDGILMETGWDRNIFSLGKVTAGTHKVTVEASTGYDADKCVLYTNMGTILPGMSFTFTEYDCELDEDGFNTYNVIYNINGTEIQPEPVPPTPEEESQWTITTILLVILVVLIAIMAVIVALRLNRS